MAIENNDIRSLISQFLFSFVASALIWRITLPRVPRAYGKSRTNVVKEEGSAVERRKSVRQTSTMLTLGIHDKIILVMVGLPARGKSFITHKIIRYLNWVGVNSKTFNAGDKRRKAGHKGQDAAFFDPNNVEGKRLREELAMQTLDELLSWLNDEGQVAVFDATNTTRKRREQVLDRCSSASGIEVIFIESICTDPEILESNYRSKCCNADYAGQDTEKALSDFKKRVAAYEKVYETLSDEEANGSVRYIKIYNVGAKVTSKGCEGYLASQVVFFLQNIHLRPRKIYLVRPGENENTKFNVLGLDLGLTEKGHRHAKRLAEFLLEIEKSENGKLLIWGGTAQRIQQTISYYQVSPNNVIITPILNELGGGDMEGLTYEEIAKLYPEDFQARQQDKLNYRYPGVGGESYMDVIERLRPLIVELERQQNSMVVVCHKAVMRVFLAYFSGIEAPRVPFVDADQDTIYEISAKVDGVTVKAYHIYEKKETTKSS